MTPFSRPIFGSLARSRASHCTQCVESIVCGQVRTDHEEIVDVFLAANVYANVSCKDVCSGLPASESLNLQFVSI